MKKDNILKLGQEVLIFNSKDNNPLSDYIKGTVVNYEDSKNGILKVLGSDGKEYMGYYSITPIMCTYFITSKDYINYLKSLSRDDVTSRIEFIKQEEKRAREAKKQVKTKLCSISDHDPGEWKEVYYTGNDSHIHSKWTTRCKRCGEIITRDAKPLEVLYKEIEEISSGIKK